MKFFLSCTLVFLITGNVFAKSTKVNLDQHEENCKTISTFAYMVMGARQNGTSLSDSLDIANSIPEKNERSIAKKITLDAYEQHKYESDEYKENARVDFADKYMLGCMKMYE